MSSQIELSKYNKTAVLETRSSDERHTVENIAAHLRAVTEEWGVHDKVVAWVHDNARNMVLSNQQLLQWDRSEERRVGKEC